jgi:hypothetical protein
MSTRHTCPPLLPEQPILSFHRGKSPSKRPHLKSHREGPKGGGTAGAAVEALPRRQPAAAWVEADVTAKRLVFLASSSMYRAELRKTDWFYGLMRHLLILPPVALTL